MFLIIVIIPPHRFAFAGDGKLIVTHEAFFFSNPKLLELL